MCVIFNLFLAFVWLTPTSGDCPPQGYDSVQPFSASSYFSGTWYSVKQQEVPYQPAYTLSCVSATYTLRPTFWCKIFQCQDTQVDVVNRGRPLLGWIPFGANLVGYIPNKKDASKVIVGNPFTPYLSQITNIDTNYWVVAAGKFSDLSKDYRNKDGGVYDWAIITVGAAVQETTSGKCLPGRNGGFWLFSRSPQPGLDIINAIEKKAEDLGLDTSVLLTVDHTNC